MILEGAAGLAAAAGFAAWAARGRSSAVFGPSLWRGPHDRRSVALTFDDGPSESTPALLRILEEHRIPATFFHCGCHVARLPEVAREVAGQGHEIGNHTYSHAALYLRSGEFIEDELTRAQQEIAATTGATPTLFRAPYGVRWFGLRRAQRRLQLQGVMWTVIGLDWKLSAEQIAGRVLRAAVPGAIICLHDGREREWKPDIRPTLEAVKRIVPALLEAGYRSETVSGLTQYPG